MKNQAKSGAPAARDGQLRDEKAQAAKPPESEIDRLLKSIGQASKLLNGAASEATRRIETLEDALLAAEPGISVWGEPVQLQQASFTRADGTLGVGQRSITLGFDKVKKDKWGIAVREQLTIEGDVVEEDVLLLRKADRGVRLRALPHLEGLVRQILSTLEDQVRQVEATPVGQAAGDEAKPSDEAEPAGG